MSTYQYRSQNGGIWSHFLASKGCLGFVIGLITIEILNQIWGGVFLNWGLFTYELAIHQGEFWRILTAPWLNGGLVHIIGVLCIFVFFAPALESSLGRRKFISLVVISGLAVPFGAILLSLSGLNVGMIWGSMGASLGILSGIYMVSGEMRVTLLFFPSPLKMKHVVLGFFGIWVLTTLMDMRNDPAAISKFIYLFGALAGFLVLSNPLFKSVSSRNTKKAKKLPYKRKVKPRTRINLEKESSSKVDQILDKISAKGFQSLTEKEKKILERASKTNE